MIRGLDTTFRFGSGPEIRTLNLAVNRSPHPVEKYDCVLFQKGAARYLPNVLSGIALPHETSSRISVSVNSLRRLSARVRHSRSLSNCHSQGFGSKRRAAWSSSLSSG